MEQFYFLLLLIALFCKSVVLLNSHEEYATIISIEHKLANTEAKAL